MGRTLVFALGFLFASALPASEATNQWYLRGPEGGYAHQIAIDPVSHQPVAGGIAGLFAYAPGLGVWNYANAGAPTPYVGAIATTTTATFVNSDGHVTRSMDGGITWTNVSSSAMGGNVSAIATSPNAPSRVYASLNPGGLYRSDNLGASWTPNAVIPGNATVAFVRASPSNANLIFVAGLPQANGTTELYRSDDGGASFTGPVCITSGTPSVPEQFFDVVQVPSNPSMFFAISGPVPGAGYTALDAGGEVRVSNDAGVTWGSPNINQFVIAPETVGGGEPRALLFDRFDANAIYIGTTWGVFKANFNDDPVLSSNGMLQMGVRDGGAQPYDEVDSLAQADDGTLYAATTSGGIYRSTNGAASWTAINAGYTGLVIRMFAFQPGNTGVVLAGSADPSNTGAVYRSTDFGVSWSRSSSGMNAGSIRGLAFSPTSPNIVLAGGFKQSGVGGESSKGLWRSTDGGQIWAKLTDSGLRNNPVRIVVFDPNDGNNALAASELRLNVSTDAGVTWTNSQDTPGLFGGLPFANNPDVILLGLAAGPKSGGGTRFYASFLNKLAPGAPLPSACQLDPLLPCKAGVYFSDDGGSHWTRGTGVTGDSASYLSVGATPGTVFVSQTTQGGYVGGVYKSTDYGATWADSSAGLPCRYIFTVAADPTDPAVVWTGCAYSDIAHPGGIYRSNDGGASWVPYGRGLRNPAISWLTVDPFAGGHVLAGGSEGIHEMHFAPDADQDGVPDAEEGVFGTVAGDANGDGTQDAAQAYVASTGATSLLAPIHVASKASALDYVVVEIDQVAPHTGTCARVSDLALVPADQIPLSNRMQQAAPTIRFILPDCQAATVKLRYSAVTDYPVGVLGSYSPKTPGDATTQAWGMFDAANVSVDGNGLWSVKLDQNAYGNVYAPDTGAILFQGAPGKDSIFGNDFE